MGFFEFGKYEPLKIKKRSVIVDTDIGPDCDDVGALAVLFALSSKYDIDVKAIVNCTSNPFGCGAIDVVSRFCGYNDIPIGMYSGDRFLCDESTKVYNKFISEKYGTEYVPVGKKTPEKAVGLYRRALSQAEYKSVVIVTIGPLNNIAALLKSKGDTYSDKDGKTLIEEKVYAVISMAGAVESKKREFNIVCDGEAAKTFADEIPVPVVYSGVELGGKIDSGFTACEELTDKRDNPIFDSYKLYSEYAKSKPYMNKSYDLTAIHFAFEGEGDFYKMSEAGYMAVDPAPDYATEFVVDKKGNSYYMDLNCSIEAISAELSDILLNARKNTPKILNFGSMNVDHVYQMPHFVEAGETIASTDVKIHVGGKGLNQSVALAKAGANVYHGGKIGNDGLFLKDFLEKNDVNCTYVMKDNNIPTGHAIIQVVPSGENSIIIYGGTNAQITEKEIDTILEKFDKGDYLLLQNEISNIDYLIESAHKKGIKTILNPSPITESLIKSKNLVLLDWVILNELEAEAFTADKSLKEVFPSANIVKTLGKKGAICIIGNEEIFMTSSNFGAAVDTTGAGDTFTGFFFANILKGKSAQFAMKQAADAAAISVTKNGAAESIPHRVKLY